MSPFRSDGHLHDLAIEDVLDEDAAPEALAHLASCGVCADRVAAAGAIALPPMRARQPANRSMGWWLSGLGIAAAALGLALLGPADPAPVDDGFNVRGSKVSLQVYRDEGGSSRRLGDGDAIATGDRLGFQVQHRAGHLMVLGIDARSEPYLCYPQRGGGRSIAVDPSPAPRTLPEAIRMDNNLGPERLVAVLCDAPFTLDEAARALQSGDLRRGCSASEITVVKP